MRFGKQWFLVMVFVVTMTMAFGQTVFADLVAGVSLGAQNIVDRFNGLNDGKGYNYKVAWSGTGELNFRIAAMAGSEYADTSAYEYPRGNGVSFHSYCVEPSVGFQDNSYGKLNYNPFTGTTKTASDVEKFALSVGGAYLYTKFATDYSFVSEGTTAYHQFGAALRFLVGETAWGIELDYLGNLLNDPYNWEGVPNPYLQVLLDINTDVHYWMSDYNPNAYYTEIGNYSVFVMNALGPEGQYGQDFLYVAHAANPYDPAAVPEPATILLWTLGSLGVMGTSFVCRRSRGKIRLRDFTFQSFRKKMIMSIRKQWILVMAFVTPIPSATGQKVFADLVAGVSLGAQNIVNDFNKQNNNKGVEFGNWWSPGEGANTLLVSPNSKIDSDLYANQNKGSEIALLFISEEEKKRMFVTFCVEPETLAVQSGSAYGKLNYAESGTRVAPTGVPLTVGAAYLYTQFVTGDLTRNFSVEAIGQAIRYLMGYALHTGTLVSEGWNSDIMQLLLSINGSRDYWFGVYDPDAYYMEIGNYSVFVMNVVTSDGTNSQDFLYLAKAGTPYLPPEPPGGDGVPEPATLLLWTLGGMGLVCSSQARKRRLKRLARAV